MIPLQSHRPFLISSLAIAAVLMWISCTALGAETPTGPGQVCILLTREGKVEVSRKGTVQWSEGQTNQVLQVGDRLRTGMRSRATLRWSDLSVIRVNELTSIEIQPPEKAGQKPQMELKSGATYFFSREKPAEIQFRTPVASGAIRGTEFHLAVAEDGRSTLSLIDGAVELTAAQRTETLQSGEQGVVDPGQPPRKSALLNAITVIQWVLYYPAVVDLDEIGLSTQEQEMFSESLKAYRSGDLLMALGSYPENRQPASDAERVLRASLLLAAGQAEPAEADLRALSSASAPARALREMMATVRNERPDTSSAPATASEWMARSYSLQSRSELGESLAAARAAAAKSPRFGAAWIRVAELEFSFGRTKEALTALEQGLELSPRQAQGLALKGFVLAARKNNSEALQFFNHAIAVDGALAHAWLGRGLINIRQGAVIEGRADLQVAATLEPQRAILRSYLGKAFSHTLDTTRAEKELALARKLDPNDPTSWLYSALLNEQENRINEAVKDLEKSKELNDNRSVFRSRLLLDQDQAVRSANLAAIYRDAGMTDFSVQEASRAVNYDYGNYSAHLFLANSYDAVRDPKLINLRYETPAYSELLVAQLLAPPGGASLSQNVSQQEYSQFFDGNHLGLFSSTEYSDNGDWVQRGSHYGVFGSSSFAFDAFYRTENGQRRNNELEQLGLSLTFKQQITAKDSLLFQVSSYDSESGDVAQYYNQNRTVAGVPAPSLALQVTEKQEPNLLVGYHREWSPGSHTLFLGGRFDDTFTLEDSTVNNSSPAVLYDRTLVFPPGTTNRVLRNVPNLTALNYRSEIVAYSAELQHIWQTPRQTLVAGARYQAGWTEASNDLAHQPPLAPAPSQLFSRKVEVSLDRISVYGYETWQIVDGLQLTAGVSYDHLYYPRNVDTSPIEDGQTSKDQVSPKAGVIWSPAKDTHLRAYYAQSLGGVFFDSSVRLEPTQIAGFNQAFRSLIPESVIGLVPGTSFETYGVGFDQAITASGTYFVVEGQFLNSDATRTVGVFTNSDTSLAAAADSPSSLRQSLDYSEDSLLVAVNQLLGKEWALGARYRLTHSDLDGRFPSLPAGTIGASAFEDLSSYLHQVNLYAIYQHRCGFFAQFDTVWSQQSNQGYTPDQPGDEFWQFNIQIGYRFFQRRVEARLGVLNLTDQDYRLNPLTLYNELPHERTMVAALKWYSKPHVISLASLRGKISRNFVAAVFGALLATGLGLYLHTFNIGRGLVNHSYELQLVARGELRTHEAVIVYMDETSHRALEQPLNAAWDRSLHARLINRLTSAGARAIVFDIIFSDPDVRNPAADAEMAKAIQESRRVVLGIDVFRLGPKDRRGIPPIELFEKHAAGIGSVEVLADSDLVVRRLNSWDDDLGIPSLSGATASFLGVKAAKEENTRLASRWMNYYGPPHFLPSVGYAEAFNPAAVEDSFFRDKVIFVGARLLTKFAGERKDEYAHPFSYWLTSDMEKQSGTMNFIAGVEIQATAFLNLLRGDWLSRLPPVTERTVIVGLGLLFGFGLVRLRPVMAVVVGLGGLAFVVAALQVLFTQKLIWFPWLIVLVQIGLALAWSILFNSVQFYVQQRLFEHTLSLYLSPKLVKKFAGNPKLLKPGAEEQVISIFFSDIADFTELSRHLDSDALAGLMNHYFETAVSKCIHHTDGTVVKYIGDAIFAFWNAPEAQPDHAWRACAAALRFRDQVSEVVNGRPLRTRIGIHSALARVGNFGSAERVDYTALGESVNLASRLEGLNKFLGTECVISRETKEGIGDRLVTRPLGLFLLKGFGKPVEVYELVGWPEEEEKTREWREAFAQALADYHARKLDSAGQGFRRTLELRPGDGPSESYLARLEELRSQPLPDDWETHTIMREK